MDKKILLLSLSSFSPRLNLFSSYTLQNGLTLCIVTGDGLTRTFPPLSSSALALRETRHLFSNSTTITHSNHITVCFSVLYLIFSYSGQSLGI